MSEKLPREERLRVLKGRLRNLQAGAGSYNCGNRVQAILQCENMIYRIVRGYE